VLVVEFRDEVFAELWSVLESHGCVVSRAISGASVAAQVKKFSPDLLLVNESMPDESGWLIACKLRLAKRRQPIWLYAVQKPQDHLNWKECCGVDEIFAYGGVLSQLAQQVSQRMESKLNVSDRLMLTVEAA
jgi:DNA-binding response OmpR family regulator